jgi:hypothetical protein
MQYRLDANSEDFSWAKAEEAEERMQEEKKLVDGCHGAKQARSPQEPQLMGEVVGVMGQLHLALQSGG